MTTLSAFKVTGSITFTIPTVVRGIEWIWNAFHLFRALLVKRVVIVTIFWGDVIYAFFMGFFWCHVIYWHVIRCSLRTRAKWWRPLSFKIKLSRSAARRSLCGNSESLRNSVQTRTFSWSRALSYWWGTSKYLRVPTKKRNMSCECEWAVNGMCLISARRKAFVFVSWRI